MAEGHLLFQVRIKVKPPPKPGTVKSLCRINVFPVAKLIGEAACAGFA